MGYKKLTDFKPKSRNPFLDDLFEVRSKRQNILVGNAEQVIVNSNTGEIEGHTAFMKYKEVDPNQFVKIFTSQVSAFYDLDKNSIRVFGYIMEKLKPNLDTIYMNPEMMKGEVGYKSVNAVISGIAKLIEKRFIDRTPNKHWYFINPTIFFNGDRISFINSFKKKGNGHYKEVPDEVSVNRIENDHSEGANA